MVAARVETDLSLAIRSAALVDTHEHLRPDDRWAGDNAKLIAWRKEVGQPGWDDERPDIQYACFGIDSTRKAILARLATTRPS